MNKKFRMVWLILVIGIVLGLGHWQEASAATITVTNLGDGAANAANCPATTNTTCRLRDAIAKAASGDTISFSVTGTIILNGGELIVSKNLTISGPGANVLTVSGNQVYRVFRITSGFTVAISGLTIANGRTTLGGGIHNSGNLTLTNVAVFGNVATLSGGGIYNLGPALNITGSTLSGNSTTVDGNGGGIYNYGTATLSNSTLSGNSAKVGGGIYFHLGSLTLTNCTLASNSAGQNSGGLYKYSSDPANLKNTIIAQNTGGTSPDISGLAITSQGNNLIGNTSGATISGVTTGNILNQNPLLAPLANYGGTTQTRPLLPGSPAINAGTATGAPTTDQRGIARVGNVDIGAFESRGFRLAIASGNNQTAVINTAFAAPLAVTVTAIGAGEPVSGGKITFTPPGIGASATIAGTPATISGSTATTGTVMANATGGSYNVGAIAPGAIPVGFVLTNCVPPSITFQPASQAICLGATATFIVTPSGTGPFGYQWRKNGVNIAGATARIYTTPATTSADNGALYSVVVTSACGMPATSANATLTFNTTGVVTSNADSGAGSLRQTISTACPGSTITFASGINLITLTSGPIIINKNVLILGPGSAVLTISGNNTNTVLQIDSGASAMLSGLTIANGSGGGIGNSGTLTITNSTLSGNSTTSDGGGIFNSGILTITNSTLSNNVASHSGGGIMNFGTLTLANSTLSGNRAGLGNGGGIRAVEGTLTLTNCTLTGNAGFGAGIYRDSGNAKIRNTIIAGNTGGKDIFTTPGFTSLGYNVIGSSVGMTSTTGDRFNANPVLAPLGNNGGSTQTHALLPGSQAINTGNNCVLNNSCPSDNLGFNLTTDQRGAGFNRQVSSAVDIGAFESTSTAPPPPLPPPPPSDEEDPFPGGGEEDPLPGEEEGLHQERKAKVVGDYDGDGKSDLAIWRGEEGQWQIILSSTGEMQTAKLGDSSSPEDVPVSGDFDGDGKADLAVFRHGEKSGHWYIKRSSDGEVTDLLFGSASDLPVAADYDGDGKTDIAVWRGAETTWYILRSSDHQEQTVSWGTSRAPYRDVPVPADYDGDGKADIAVFRQANGHWYIRQSSDGAVIDRAWGLRTDVPVAADYDGDGKADIAVWRGAEGVWYVLRSSDSTLETVSWGTSSLDDVPVLGDYDGDGKADVAFWRASEGVWYVKSSADASSITKTHGQSGDRPVNARQQ